MVEQQDDRILNMNDFSITNASVKRLIVTGVLLNYVESIRRAFPALVSFCGVQDNRQYAKTRPVMMDLLFLSNTIVNFTVYLSKERESQPALFQNVSSDDILRELLPRYAEYYKDFYYYLLNNSKSNYCMFGMKFKICLLYTSPSPRNS